ncbi:MAG: hypothetical protein ONB44_05540 [candidate division KSB1 bacterium]|nr:hypothetical protein [candidate division KSB1 bacterium]MDZ7301588.1 hypothetical protein [candidate division KSB1 bacterium]MDZ7310996.1 hypothetical protein [candidate division KSB1 bacterium]
MINIGGRNFHGPFSLSEWVPPTESGVYAILTGSGVMLNQDELLYIGISRNFADGRIGPSHYAYRSWIENSEPRGNLFVAIYPMPYASELLLALEEEKLVKFLNPLCNQLHSPIMKALFR